MFKNKRLGLNLGRILSISQLECVLQLLSNEDNEYRIQERRINIFSYGWQFAPFYIFRQALAYLIKDKELKKVTNSTFAH
jgi:hypothetical protein